MYSELSNSVPLKDREVESHGCVPAAASSHTVVSEITKFSQHSLQLLRAKGSNHSKIGHSLAQGFSESYVPYLMLKLVAG